jgi:hypothetical protein
MNKISKNKFFRQFLAPVRNQDPDLKNRIRIHKFIESGSWKQYGRRRKKELLYVISGSIVYDSFPVHCKAIIRVTNILGVRKTDTFFSLNIII